MITDRPQGDGNDAGRSEAIEELRRYGSSLRGTISPVQAQAAATRALAGHTARGWSRRWVLAAATAGFLAISSVGLAAASDSSLPGDSLYGIKRGYEQVTALFGASHVSVRIEEASQLIILGRNATAVAVLAEALAELEVTDVTAALEEAEALLQEGDEDTLEVAQAATELVKATEGIAIAARAGNEEAKQAAIADVRDRAANVAATARGNSPNFSGFPPIGQDGEDGESGDGGPPFGLPEGPPDHAGPPDDVGNSNNTGSSNGGSSQGGPPSDDTEASGNNGSGNSNNSNNSNNRSRP
ncbi:MAG TPA: hypothetical protein VM470_01385 [Acidimicrobiia bacterium]|nr:hypothetical protein [Acidimicrobiia bacterium]